ncbi:thermophilic glucose-6-phosphate isomerase [Aaosphaeria arxii CBS 175.79]|uniref:Thermophilic glucose-6-phosphate isomerase n=1 Tax=Aaosphaeria arxii CBS 175.79 TaxID=1450172 RepID=A0A6A5Y3P8_9PLEO|nr:thermophilic glucose-6-phosphate isomerase [Aaosphaeria arxii CBS 175.79]KAF2019899.1 thermophilic glucose-6-phosphate isomerase [Aaosphaeria arxii CBS 175.79]
MKFTSLTTLLFATAAFGGVVKREESQFKLGQPIDGKGKGAPILGGTNKDVDLANPSNLGEQSTDAGTVPNLKWRFSDSKTKIFPGGWVREQVDNDLPQSHDIAAAQQHLKKGAIRELHWHRVAEWGFVYAGRVLVSAVDENGKYQVDILEYGDIWYFPKGQAHTVQGLDDENEYLLVFDDGDFDRAGTTFNLDDWIARTPKHILAKNFGVPESVFDKVPEKNPYILNSTSSTHNVTGGNGELVGNSSYVYHTFQHPSEPVAGGGGVFYKIDSTNFPISTTIASTFVILEPGGLRELHWHPTAEEWLYFHEGTARATVFTGNGNSRTFDFSAGDTAVFPDNSGHYIENTSKDQNLTWIEIYKSDRVADVSLTQWLALTPADIAAAVLKVPIEFVETLKKEKQVLIKGSK